MMTGHAYQITGLANATTPACPSYYADPGISKPAPSAGPAACAVVTRDYLSHALVLIESFRLHYPDGRFYLLVLDSLPIGVHVGDEVHLLGPLDVGCPHFWEMSVRYDSLQLCCAVKPFLVATLLEKFCERVIFYFDSDILIFRRLIEAERLLTQADMLLTPHILEPIEADGKLPEELDILAGGVYNMGFFAMRNSEESIRLLRWWSSRLRDKCGTDRAAGMYLDQRWADLMPALFPSVAQLRDPTYNVAYWNLQERCLEDSPTGLNVNQRPLAFFHFSGLDINARSFRDTHQTRTTVHPGTPLGRLVESYARLQDQHRREECRSWGNAFQFFDNGVAFHPLLRRLYLRLDEGWRLAFGNPFLTGSTDAFLAWALRRDADGFSPLLREIAATPEGQQRFPAGSPRLHKEFVRWAEDEGARELGLDPSLVRSQGD